MLNNFFISDILISMNKLSKLITIIDSFSLTPQTDYQTRFYAGKRASCISRAGQNFQRNARNVIERSMQECKTESK